MPSPPLRVGIVILAAGASRRMGRPKQLLPIGSKSLLEHAVDAALGSAAWPVVVVLGANATEIRPVLARRPVLVAENSAWTEGMASSLRAGLTVMNAFSARIDAVLFALCDQPRFSSAVVGRILATQQSSQRAVVAARYGGHLGAPALFTRPHFAALNALVGDEGARKLIATLPPGEVAAIDLPELAQDLDTPEDYAGYRQPAP
jgi:CTP:molybdopterin cytidylyltransferase MocA